MLKKMLLCCLLLNQVISKAVSNPLMEEIKRLAHIQQQKYYQRDNAESCRTNFLPAYAESLNKIINLIFGSGRTQIAQP